MRLLSDIQNLYIKKSKYIYVIASVLMLYLAARRLSYQIWRLLFEQTYDGAIDLRNIHQWVNLWFIGEPLKEIIYLPATHAMLWLFTGWLSFESARWLWLYLYIISVVWLIYIVIRESDIEKKDETVFAALFTLSMYPTGITIGNGQVILFLLPCILTAVLIERKHEHSIAKDAIVSLLFLLSSLKFTVTAPFFFISLITQKAFRPLLLAACCYIVLTYIAMTYRAAGLIKTLRTWLEDSSALATSGGYANIHIWLSSFGLQKLILPFSLILILSFCVWLYKFRKIDIWIQLGVAAIIARLWTYHRLYDDLLILVPVITIFRIVRSGELSPHQRFVADFLLLISWLSLLSPGYFLQLPFPIGSFFRTCQAVIWVLMLIYLVYYASKVRKTETV